MSEYIIIFISTHAVIVHSPLFLVYILTCLFLFFLYFVFLYYYVHLVIGIRVQFQFQVRRHVIEYGVY